MSGPLLVGVVNPSALPVTCLVNLIMMNMDSPILTALGTVHLTDFINIIVNVTLFYLMRQIDWTHFGDISVLKC